MKKYESDKEDVTGRINLGIQNLVLEEDKWSNFQEIMNSDDEPTDYLRRLMSALAKTN